MNNTVKSKSVPKNNTRKRCPKGERWNKAQNKCLPRIINNAEDTTNSCSKKYWNFSQDNISFIYILKRVSTWSQNQLL